MKPSDLEYGWIRYVYGKNYIDNMRIALVTKSTDKATIGNGTVFNDEDILTFQFKTLELPWHDNKKSISCIPPGPCEGPKDYLVHNMPPTIKRPYNYFWVQNVEGRAGILWHPGNYTRQILGCCLPGDQIIDIDKDGTPDITNTKHTLKILTSLMPKIFKLTIMRT